MSKRTNRSWAIHLRCCWFTGLAALVAISGSMAVRPASAQREVRAVPDESYLIAKAAYQSGKYAPAIRGFREAARNGVRSTEGLWIDSICYHTMLGECLYHLGQLGDALDQYDAALKLALTHRDWMLRVSFPEVITPSSTTARSRITWGRSKRATAIAHLPDKMGILQGAVNNVRALRFGGPIALRRELFAVRAEEINRCTALALRRRRDIMGPVCRHDPLTNELVNAFARRPAPANHWSQAWVDVHLGLAYASEGRIQEANSALQRSLMLAGKFDHRLTSTALLELGKLALEQKSYRAAGVYFLEATFTAAVFGQYDVMQEAFRAGANVHVLTNQRGGYGPLSEAAAWARREGAFPLQAELALLAAENALHQGNSKAAATLLDQTGGILKRRDLLESDLAGRWQYETAHLQFQSGRLTGGATALTAALSRLRQNSHWLFQIGLADKLAISGVINPRIAELVYDELLREPTSEDWLRQPRETMTVLATPTLLPMEHWFELVLSRKKPDKALEIADRIRRKRFYASLPAGGRLLALRWVLSAPIGKLSPAAQIQRQGLLVKFPKYAALSGQIEKLRLQLQPLPLAPKDDESRKLQSKLLDQIAKLSATQELLLHDLALRRENAEFAFPPLLNTKETLEQMPQDQIVLTFFSTQQALHGFALNGKDLIHWRVDQPASIKKRVSELLLQMGNYSKNQQLDTDRFAEKHWRETARQLFQQLTERSRIKNWEQYQELVMVPDGVLWYLPFEALPIVHKGKSAPLISRMRVRYAPTVSLSLRDNFGNKPLANTAVVAGQLFPRDDAAISADALDKLGKQLPRTEQIPDKLPAAANLFATRCDRLIVWQDVLPASGGPYNWSPLQIDRGKPGSTLASWLSLPWGTPQQLVLPGYHTAAESSLKQGGSSGQEVFLNLCGLMGSGARSILISRWRTGGQSSYDLVHQYVTELPHTTAADAWQRSTHLLWESEIDPSQEPRVKEGKLVEPILGEHPFFWAGYLLVDSASDPTEKDPPADKADAD